MALSFKEKRQLQKTVSNRLNDLKSGDLSFKEKRAAQKELKEAFAKLKVVIETKPEAAARNEKLAALIAGKYDDKSPQEFLDILKEIYDEINDIEPLKEPTISYIKKKKGSGEAITESVIDALPGVVDDDENGGEGFTEPAEPDLEDDDTEGDSDSDDDNIGGGD